jgi:putative hemolysin
MPSIFVELIVIVVLLGVNAFLAASEISIVSSRKARLQGLADAGNRAAKHVLALIESPSGFLATVQVGITLAGFFASAVGAVSLARVLEGPLEDAPIGFVANNAGGVALVLVTALLSFVSIVFGELVPKTLAVQRAEGIALRVVRPVEILATITRPIVALLTITTNGILRLLGSHERARLPSVTEAELLAMLETAEDEGVVEASEASLVEEALGFDAIIVRSVMVPRVDVAALEARTPLSEAMERFFATGYSRLPVYRETTDAIVGILYVKDVARLIWTDQAAASQPVGDVVRPAHFVPETKPIDELLHELRTRHTHMAIVIDEYGGMAGVVTMEDLIEELVGEITDEFDRGYEPFRQVADGRFEVDGRLSLVDLYERLNLPVRDLSDIPMETVGGLITERLGRIPEPEDAVDFGPLHINVTAMDGYRVALAVVRLRTDKQEEVAAPDS